MLTKKSEAGTWVAMGDALALLNAAGQSAIEGERRLMLAILAHALRSLFHDAEKPGRGAARRLRQDLRWLTDDDRSDVFAFERICEALDLDAQQIRTRVLEDLGVKTAVLMPPPRVRRGRRDAPQISVGELHAIAV